MGSQTIVLEFGERRDLPMRIALSATAENVAATIGPLAGGVIADLLGYNFVLGVSLVVFFMALTLLAFSVGEPRDTRGV